MESRWHERPRQLAQDGRSRLPRRQRTRRIRRRRRRFHLRRHRHGRVVARARARPHDVAAFRHLHALHHELRQRGAEAPLPPRRHQRRDHPGDRDDRAGHRLRSRRRADHRAARRRSLRDQRLQDFHLQRPDCRPRYRRLQDRPQGQPSAQGRQLDAGRRERARLRPRPQARQARDSAARTPASCSSRTAASRPATCSARKARASRC